MVSSLVMELLVMELLEFGLDSYRDWNLDFGFWNLVIGIWYLEFGIWNLEFGN